MVSTFQLTRQTRLSLTHQEKTEGTEGQAREELLDSRFPVIYFTYCSARLLLFPYLCYLR